MTTRYRLGVSDGETHRESRFAPADASARAEAPSQSSELRAAMHDDEDASQLPAFHIVLLHPEIPNNTGNIGRTAVATGCRLHVIHPIGFDMDEKARRRAGLDYWHLVDCREHASWEAFLATERPARLWLMTTKSGRSIWDAPLRRGDYLLFGRETKGVDAETHRWVDETYGADHRLTLPMVPIPEARSLNLATAAAIAVYEGLRQLRSAGTLPWQASNGRDSPEA